MKKIDFKNIDKSLVYNAIIAIISVAIVAVVSGLFTNPSSSWYLSLVKPSTFMPSIVFPIVWTTIYALFAVVIFLMLQDKSLDAKGITLLAINGLLQILWCAVYFTAQKLFGGLIIIALVLVSSILLVVYLYNKKPLYGYLLLIYPIWILLATCLNLATWILN